MLPFLHAKVTENNLFPFWFQLQKETGKNFRLDSEDLEWSELIVTMYHENSNNNTIFIGEVKLSLLGSQQQIHAATNAW